MRVSDARMDRAISSHKHLVQLLTTGTKSAFLGATSEHLRLAHQQAAGLR
jgi:hypothetical protein